MDARHKHGLSYLQRDDFRPDLRLAASSFDQFVQDVKERDTGEDHD